MRNASHRLAPRTALTVEQEDGIDVVYLSHLPSAQIVVAPSPGAKIILAALGRTPTSAHPDTQTYLAHLTDRGLLLRNDDDGDGVETDQLHVLISAQPSSPWFAAALPPHWRVLPRPIESGSPAAIAGRRLRTCWRLVRRSREVEIVILSSAGYEMVILGLLRPLVRCAVIVHDPILPTARTTQALLSVLAKGFDAVWCIRTSDLPRWQRAGLVTFLPFFGPTVDFATRVAAASETPGIYSGGTAHRDFEVVIKAAEVVGLPTTIGTTQPLPSLPANVEQKAPHAATEGRALQEQAGISVFVLQPTILAAGPTVLLDAMAAGAAIVCNDAPGHRDYVTDGVDALVVPAVPRVDDLARAIQRLVADPELRVRLGTSARERVATLRSPYLVPRYVAEAERVVADRSARVRRTFAVPVIARKWRAT